MTTTIIVQALGAVAVAMAALTHMTVEAPVLGEAVALVVVLVAPAPMIVEAVPAVTVAAAASIK